MRARRSSGGRWALASALVVAVLANACAGEAGDDVVSGSVDFEATGRFLSAASQRSAGEPFRVEVSMAMDVAGGGEEISLDAPIMTGEQDGRGYEYHMDMEEWLSQVPGGAASLGGGDLTMDMTGDASALYIRAPIYASLAEQAGPAGIGPMGELAELGDRWGRVDLEALGDLSVIDLQSTAGAPGGTDPRAMLDAVASADDVEELGTDEIDGTPVNGLGARLSLRELLEAQGVDGERFIDQMSANLGGLNQTGSAGSDAVTETVFQAEVPFEVWVDGDGYVRRVAYDMDALEILSGMEGFASGRLDRFVTSQTIDFSDYGADDIEIEHPSDAVDVTDAYRRMLEAGQAGG
jgi:hypothetical protein